MAHVHEQVFDPRDSPLVPRALLDLLDAAEHAAGPGADNLTLIAMRWEASGAAANAGSPTSMFSDEDIGLAIARSRRDTPHNPNGAAL